MKELLTLHIQLLDTVEVASDRVRMVQISFTGTAEGPYFQGEILPGAVDTQTVRPDGTGNLSARYTLRGTDAEGKACMLYIENEAELGSEETRPTIVTDSPALAFLMEAGLTGRLHVTEEEVTIRIYGEVENTIMNLRNTKGELPHGN